MTLVILNKKPLFKLLIRVENETVIVESKWEHETYNYEDTEEAIKHEKQMIDDGWEIVGRWTELETEFRKSK
ncbi:hypothetical protein PPM_p0219 (plasmid) [Paenibacillus polymyxa M1]|nr:hypothetical protein PPM_p0219 [Paenibacillus polymyxa M1]